MADVSRSVDVTGRQAAHDAPTEVAPRLGTAGLVLNNAGVQLISPIIELTCSTACGVS